MKADGTLGALLWAALLIAVAIWLGGCTTAQKYGQKGADVADGALETAEWTLCYAASVGSIRRRYAVSAERLAAWRDLCQASESSLFEAR